jgi:hypothetical protein
MLNQLPIIKMIQPRLYIAKAFVMMFILQSVTALAQKDTSKIPVPVKNRVVNYEEAYVAIQPKTKAAIFKKAEQWMAATFKGDGQAIKNKDAEAGKITGTGMFKIITSQSGNYYWLRFDVVVSITDNGCIIDLLNYYEKPIEKGISNEYSKIEYRWGDFRRGKPWSAEDEPLFQGLNTQSRALMAAFKTAMDK